MKDGCALPNDMEAAVFAELTEAQFPLKIELPKPWLWTLGFQSLSPKPENSRDMRPMKGPFPGSTLRLS